MSPPQVRCDLGCDLTHSGPVDEVYQVRPDVTRNVLFCFFKWKSENAPKPFIYPNTWLCF